MKGFLALFVFLVVLTACGTPTDESSSKIIKGVDIGANITRFHDDEFSVTCWKYARGYKGGLSCIPDHLLEAK